jgi:hypothetical protein
MGTSTAALPAPVFLARMHAMQCWAETSLATRPHRANAHEQDGADLWGHRRACLSRLIDSTTDGEAGWGSGAGSGTTPADSSTIHFRSTSVPSAIRQANPCLSP